MKQNIKRYIFSEGMIILTAKTKQEALEKLCSIESELEAVLDKSEDLDHLQENENLIKNAPKITNFINKL